MKIPFRLKVFSPLIFLFAVLIAFTPRTAKWSYEYRKGSVWQYETCRARLDFPILKTEAQKAEEALRNSSVRPPYFKLSEAVAAENLAKASGLDYLAYPELEPAIVSSLRGIYAKGVVSDAGLTALEGQEIAYVQKDKRAQKVPATELYGLASARTALLAKVTEAFPEMRADSVLRACGAYELIAPNLVFDEQLTSLVSSQTENTVSETVGFVRAGDVIISKGDIVTEELAQVLDSYKAEYEHSVLSGGKDWQFWLANILICLAILVCFYFAIHFSNPLVFKDYNRYLYILTLFALMAALEMSFIRLWPKWLLLVPFPVFALYLKAFFRTRVIYPVYIVSLLPLLLFASNGQALFLMYVASGTVTLYVFNYFSRGVKQFVLAIVTFVISALVYFACSLTGLVTLNFPNDFIFLLVAAFLQIAAYPIIYLMERIFNLVSTSRLDELAENSNELLRDLEKQAPGTFQHSLQVSALAQSIARAIGADESLVKVGALYHDIGKMNNPLCFVENESLITSDEAKYHSELTPLQSAQDIIKHVTDGMELAHDHHLPTVVSDFILTHHGTNCVSYFYDKFLKEGGDPAQKPEFCYPGRKPHTKEQVILMICDTLEAASRALRDYSPEAISNLVERLIQDKIDDGQLEEADITVKELTTAKQVIKSYIAQIHHERIKYPTRRKK
ncbi:MAG: HDIG domain-containing protein [Bacteroidales bacterium]|nr:HDIG domain-containing protein [Bacteroidales bacterium]